MSDTVIKVENLSKLYRLGVVGTGTLTHDINRWWHKVRGKEDPYSKIGETNIRETGGESEYVWALKDINFEVKQGEVLGIIGKNGAGKSTLLKLLSKVTGPTEGRILAKGRIASLLEVGTGFHPELTGRENIYLNGTILGMTRREVDRKLEEIVEFAGVARYVDTPVKRYSSGMKVRLGFAVAAHLEPEILIVDEVLAVGDAEFQKKAIGKMQEVSHQGGRTVLFVSHNMASIKSLCAKTLLLENGAIASVGDTDSIINSYLKGNSLNASDKRFQPGTISAPGIDVLGISVYARGKTPDSPIIDGEEVLINTAYYLEERHKDKYHLTYVLLNELGDVLFSFSHARDRLELKTGLNNLICCFPKQFFNTGNFYLSLYIIEDKRKAVHIEKDIAEFVITNRAVVLGTWMGREPGFLKPSLQWEIEDDYKISKPINR